MCAVGTTSPLLPDEAVMTLPRDALAQTTIYGPPRDLTAQAARRTRQRLSAACLIGALTLGCVWAPGLDWWTLEHIADALGAAWLVVSVLMLCELIEHLTYNLTRLITRPTRGCAAAPLPDRADADRVGQLELAHSRLGGLELDGSSRGQMTLIGREEL
jgi:hypothetical protein